MKRFVLCALAASMVLAGAAAGAQAHIPTECAVRSQELGWALEGAETTYEHVKFSREIVEIEIDVDAEIGPARAESHIRQLDVYIRVLEGVRCKALLLIGCIHEPPSISLPAE